MYLSFNGQRLRLYSSGVSISRKARLDAAQEPFGYDETWDITHRVKNTGSTSADLDPLIAAVESRFSQTASEISLQHGNQTNTVHAISAAETVGGIRVTTPPHYPEFRNGEHVTYRVCRIVVEFLRITKDAGYVIDFSQMLDIQEGGATYDLLTPNVGLSQRQRTRTDAPWTATQQGRIVVLGERPADPPGPIWPDWITGPVKKKLSMPVRVGRNASSYLQTEMTYQWNFKAASAIQPPLAHKWIN